MASAVHISLNVSDLPKSVEFYRGFLGEPKKLKQDYAKFVTGNPEIHLALQPGSSEAAGHGLAVAPRHSRRQPRRGPPLALDLKARGIVSEEEKREACCYALQEKFWLSDPDGNRWEVYTVLEDVEDVSREAQAACCAR